MKINKKVMQKIAEGLRGSGMKAMEHHPPRSKRVKWVQGPSQETGQPFKVCIHAIARFWSRAVPSLAQKASSPGYAHWSLMKCRS